MGSGCGRYEGGDRRFHRSRPALAWRSAAGRRRLGQPVDHRRRRRWGIDGTRRVLEWLAARDEIPDACVVGEPTCAAALGDMIKIGRRGSLTGRLTAQGVQGHTAYPQLADNAAHRLVKLLHALTTAELDQGSAHFQPSTLQIASIDIGNPAAN